MNRFIPSPQFASLVADATVDGRLAAAETVVRVADRTVNDDTGAYDRSLSVFVDERGVGAETDDFAGHIIEYGSIHQEPQAPIRTGAAAAGRFEPR